MITQENMGKYIAEKRKEKGMTQEQFAEKLGVSNRSVSRWENGKTLPDYSLFPAICEMLQVSVSELLEGPVSEKSDNSNDKMHLIVELLDYEKQKKEKAINRCFFTWSICLILKILHIKFHILDFVPNTYLLVQILNILRILCLCLILYYNNQKQKYAENELKIFLGTDQNVRMRTAGEMLLFARRNQKAEFKQYQKAFHSIEEKLEPKETAVFSMVADTFFVNESWQDSWKPWYISLAVTEKRLLVCGEAIHGRFMTFYDVESFLLKDIETVEMVHGKIVIKLKKQLLTIEGKDLKNIVNSLKTALNQ